MNLHHLDAYDYALPSELIAQSPAVQRRDARLLDGRHATPRDTWFTDLPNMLRSGDVLVLNDTQVLKARLWGHKASGGKVELLVERVLGEAGLEAAVHMRVSRKPKVGEQLHVASLMTPQKRCIATVLRSLARQRWRVVSFAALTRHGKSYTPGYVPLPLTFNPPTRRRLINNATKPCLLHPGAVVSAHRGAAF